MAYCSSKLDWLLYVRFRWIMLRLPRKFNVHCWAFRGITISNRIGLTFHSYLLHNIMPHRKISWFLSHNGITKIQWWSQVWGGKKGKFDKLQLRNLWTAPILKPRWWNFFYGNLFQPIRLPFSPTLFTIIPAKHILCHTLFDTLNA